jgi:hypothetical protein
MATEPERYENERELRLSSLWTEYRDAIPDPEPSVNFMPQVWARIEERQTFAFGIRRFARGIITAAAAVSLLMAVYLSVPQRYPSAFYQRTYLELLAAGQNHDQAELADAEIVEAVHDAAQ